MTTFLVGGERQGDTVRFTIDLPDDKHLYRVFLVPQNFVADGPKQNIELFVAPGERVAVRGSYEPKSKVIEYTLDGSDAQQRWRELEQEIEPLRLRLEMMSMMARMVAPEQHRADDSLSIQVQRLADTIEQVRQAYIEAHPADPVSGYRMLTLTDAVRFDSLYNLLDPSVRNGAVKEWLDLQKEANERIAAAEKARRTVAEGNVAPDFTLPDAAGKNFTLSSLYGQGKYIVIDFWGTWCGWCMKGMPAMKEAYDKYNAKVEFVGIDCGDKLDTWCRTVEEQALRWINVRADENSDVAERFGVEGFPTKLILDPQGTIVARFTGESPAFYSTLDSLAAQH